MKIDEISRKIWQGLVYFSNHQFNVGAVASHHFNYNDKLFKFTSWILTTAAVGIAARLTHSAIIELWYYYLIFRIVVFSNWFSISLSEKVGPTDFSQKNKRLVITQLMLTVISWVVGAWLALPSGLPHLLDVIVTSHGSK